MNNLDELFLHIHHLTKFSVHGGPKSEGLTAAHYASASEEGRKLEAALQTSAEYHTANPNWFNAHYQKRPVHQIDPSTGRCTPFGPFNPDICE